MEEEIKSIIVWLLEMELSKTEQVSNYFIYQPYIKEELEMKVPLEEINNIVLNQNEG